MLVKTFASAVHGVNAQTITVEVNAGGMHTGNGPFYQMVGLPDSTVREGFQRIEAAITNSRFQMIRLKMTMNLAPADIRKEGSAYDLPIAIGVLAATKQIPPDGLDEFVIMGELSLDGSLRPIRGALPIAIQSRAEKFKGLILPKQNAREAAIVNHIDVYGASTLREAVELVMGQSELKPTTVFLPAPDDRDHSRKHASSLARAVTSEIRNVHGYETATTGLDFTPVHFVDVRAQMVLKMEALAAYQAMGAPRVDLRPRMAQAYARYWGRFHEFGEVEAFEDVRNSAG